MLMGVEALAQDRAGRSERNLIMLTLTLRRGDYFTIGDDIVIQALPDKGTVRLRVDAPRDFSIVRGTVLEKNGAERPEQVREFLTPRKKTRNRSSPKQKERTAQYYEKLELWHSRKDEAQDAVNRITSVLDNLDNPSEVAEIKAQLARILPVLMYNEAGPEYLQLDNEDA